MQILGIETSSKFLSLAISKDNKIIAQINIDAYRKLSSLLIDSIKNVLRKANLKLEELDGFAVGLGPGSFTGLRIGITTVKALALSLNKPVVGISSLDVIAQNIFPSPHQICVILDAKRDNVFSCIYEYRNNKIKKLSRDLLINIKDLIKRTNKKTVFLGDGLAVFDSLIKKDKKQKASFAEQKFWYPNASNLLMLAFDKFKRKNFINTDNLVPMYLYPKECQIKSNKKINK